MEIFRIIGVGFITAIAAVLLKSTKPELSFAVSVTGVILILLFLAEMLGDTVGALSSIAEKTGVGSGSLKILLKIVGIGYLTEFCAGILQDFGNAAVADKVVLGGKLTVLVLSLPIIEKVLELFSSFLGLL